MKLKIIAILAFSLIAASPLSAHQFWQKYCTGVVCPPGWPSGWSGEKEYKWCYVLVFDEVTVVEEGGSTSKKIVTWIHCCTAKRRDKDTSQWDETEQWSFGTNENQFIVSADDPFVEPDPEVEVKAGVDGNIGFIWDAYWECGEIYWHPPYEGATGGYGAGTWGAWYESCKADTEHDISGPGGTEMTHYGEFFGTQDTPWTMTSSGGSGSLPDCSF